jgi:GNAT superfamily N-acetyltransferase
MASVTIRSAIKTDLARCLLLDPAYDTDYVWQMERKPLEGQVSVMFRTVKLPRSMRVAYPRDQRALQAGWQSCDALLVAEDATGSLVGYAALAKRAPQATLMVHDLIVTKPLRRTGIASALLKAAARWGSELQLRWLMLEVQTKNYPAIGFCEKHGLSFCGYNDHYFANQDIALFFAQALH